MSLTFTLESCTEVPVSTTPGYVTAYVSIVVSSTTYIGVNSVVFDDAFVTTPGFLYGGITFPALTVTQFTPGQLFTVVWALVLAQG
jgi:hypothetical protein